MKNKNISSNLATGLVALVGLAMSLACGSFGGASNANLSKTGNSDSIAENHNSADTKKDTTPLTVTIGEVMDSSNVEKFKDRMLTVTGGRLWEIESSNIKVKDSYGSAYIVCSGNFSEYTSMSSKVAALEKEGKPVKVEIKGVFVSGARSYYSAELEPCVISDLEK